MLARIAVLLLAFQFLGAARPASPPSVPDELRSKLGKRVTDYSLEANSFVEALTRVAGEFQIPIGIAWVNAPAARAKVSLSMKSATVLELIEAVVKTQPGYEVSLGKSVVHVSSASWVPGRQSPLTLKVKKFEVHGETVEVASRQLHDLVRIAASPPKLPPGGGHRGGVAGSLFGNSDEPKISVQLSDVTIEDALDAIIHASARKIWIVTFSNSLILTPKGFRRTQTLWNNFPIPDSEQPLWDLLHWGDALQLTVLPGK
jgi:hypothetical protein